MRSRKLIVLEANIDDMNPQWFEPLMERLFEAGALDVTLIPAIMKKSRPATIVQVLTEPKRRDQILKIIFEESTTLGIRSYAVERHELKRVVKKIQTEFGTVEVKIGRDGTGSIVNISPEYESCKLLAKKKKVPLKKIYQAALCSSNLDRSRS